MGLEKNLRQCILNIYHGRTKQVIYDLLLFVTLINRTIYEILSTAGAKRLLFYPFYHAVIMKGVRTITVGRPNNTFAFFIKGKANSASR
mmetsp:Transcript_22600/g.35140  ORF Transcript_22600/g.35140 Transcript_22600/m.35140 type:complete len:89 (-) Transcript_22600:282-548(-)